MIIVDAMGGARAVKAPLEAAAALSLRGDLELVLVGNEPLITDGLSKTQHDPARLVVHHGADGASIDAAMERLSQDMGSALVTAASPAEVIPAAARHLEMVPGIEKAALCAVYPTVRRRGKRNDPFVLILDVGADFNASVDDLVGYAQMGAAYASRISHNPTPRVGVLGSRVGDACGPPEAVEAVERLTGRPRGEMLVTGIVEGLDIPLGSADVIVCSGALGHVVIKLLEGVGQLVSHLGRSMQERSIKARFALQAISSDMQSFTSLTDWKEYGGAPLLGYDRPVVLLEPDAEKEAFERAIRLAAKTVRKNVIGAFSG